MNFAKLSNDELQELLAARTQHARAIDAEREVAAYGYEKITRTETINGKLVWFYRLMPYNSKAQVVAA